VLILIDSAEALTSDLITVVHVMRLGTHEHSLPKMDPFTVNRAYCKQLLKQMIPGNLNIMQSKKQVLRQQYSGYRKSQQELLKTVSYLSALRPSH
jgi:hypothetical protein